MPSATLDRPTRPAEEGRAARWLAPVLWLNAALQVIIIVTGGIVRLSGSGLGCPTWPQCVPGSYTPVAQQAQGFHKFIEFGNRTLTGVLLIVAVAALVLILKAAPRRHLIVKAALVLAVVVLQAVIGGITVLVGLHPITVAAHFLLSGALVGIATNLYLTRDEPDGAKHWLVPPLARSLSLVTCVAGAVVLTLGTVVTGSGPHSGDAVTPARFGFDPRTISWLHADAVMLFIGLVVACWIAARLTATAGSTAASAWAGVLLVTLAQGVVGYTQYLTSLPWLLVLTHMLLAALLVVTLTRAMVASRARAATSA